MKTFGKFTKIAVAAAVTGALVLPASAAFAGDKSNKTERAILGAVIGGIAGAALSNGDKGGIAIGAVAGAALGALDRRQRSRSPLLEQLPRSPLRLWFELQQRLRLQ